jgi:hypothetical protein
MLSYTVAGRVKHAVKQIRMTWTALPIPSARRFLPLRLQAFNLYLLVVDT